MIFLTTFTPLEVLEEGKPVEESKNRSAHPPSQEGGLNAESTLVSNLTFSLTFKIIH